MNHFDLAQAVLECGERGEPLDKLTTTFQRAIESLGFPQFACCSQTDPSKPAPGAVMLHNYPATLRFPHESSFSIRGLATKLREKQCVHDRFLAFFELPHLKEPTAHARHHSITEVFR